MKYSFSFVLLLLLAFVMPAESQKYEVDSAGLFLRAEQWPVMVGGDDVAGRFIRRNVRYPVEAWREAQITEVAFKFIVTDKGEIRNVRLMGEERIPSALRSELLRVAQSMPKWKPGYVGGRAVNTWRSLRCDLIDGMGRFEDGTFFYPPCFKKWLLPAIKQAADKTYAHGMSKAEEDKKMAVLAHAYGIVPDCAATSAAYARLLAGSGRGAEAVAALDSSISRYSLKNRWDEDDVEAIYDRNPQRMGYVGKTELWLRLLRVVIADAGGLQRGDSLLGAYADVAKHIGMKIRNHDIAPMKSLENRERFSTADEQRLHQLMQEKAMLVHNNPERLSPDEIADVEREQTLGGRMAVIDKYIGQGKISNARVVQITGEIADIENKPPQIAGIAENTARLYAVAALLAYLHDGTTAQHEYLQQVMRSATKEMQSLVYQWQKRISDAGLTDADRADVVRCLACYAPRQGESADSIKRFYELRKRVWAVYPMEWLSKCDI